MTARQAANFVPSKIHSTLLSLGMELLCFEKWIRLVSVQRSPRFWPFRFDELFSTWRLTETIVSSFVLG